MSKRLFVGNVSFKATEADLRGLFEQQGKVLSVRLITDRDTGKPRGFGFVEMEADDADKAVNTLNGFELQGRPLRVNEARERNDAQPPRM